MKTKPFDLEPALAGAKVVTRQGKSVTGLRRRSFTCSFPIIGETEYDGAPIEFSWTTAGNFIHSPGSKHDLFLVDESPIRTKPFNLEAALKGEPVVTRDGRPVIDLKRFETVNRIYGVMNGSVTGWGLDGSLVSSGETKADLFMVAPEPKMREVWLNLYPSGATGYDTKIDADVAASRHRIGKSRRVLIPEEESE